jgi:hypothetical protein
MRFWIKFLLAVLLGSAGISWKTAFEVLSKIFAGAGLLALLKVWIGYLLGFPFGDVGALITEAYDAIVEFALIWAHPFVHDLVKRLFPGWELAEHWKNVTTLTALYMSRSVINALFVDLHFTDRHGNSVHWVGDKQAAAWRAVWGLTLALIAGIGVGLIHEPLPATGQDPDSTLATLAGGYLFVAVPVIAVALYQIGNGGFQAVFRTDLEYSRRPGLKTRFGIIRGFAGSAIERTLDVLIAPRHAIGLLFNAPLWLVAASALKLPNPGFAPLFAFVAYLGWIFASEGKEQAQSKVPDIARDWRDVYFEQGSARIGVSILGALAWTFILYMADQYIGPA